MPTLDRRHSAPKTAGEHGFGPYLRSQLGAYLLLELFPLFPHLLQGLSHSHTHNFSLAPFILEFRKQVGD